MKMNDDERQHLLHMLKVLKVEARPFACLGCGFEHGCSTQGCQVIEKAAAIVAAAGEKKVSE